MIHASDRTHRRVNSQGFTLIEVLVAVAIVALGLAGILTTINGMVNASAYLRDKTLANWVAQNHITELRLQPDWPDIGKSTDDMEMGGQRWRVETEVESTPVENLRRLNVSVAYDEVPDEPLVTVAAFMGQPTSLSPHPDWRAGAPQQKTVERGNEKTDPQDQNDAGGQ